MKITVLNNGISKDAPEIENLIDIQMNKTVWLNQLESPPPQDESPPVAGAEMFPGILREIVDVCCAHSEAVPVAVATYTLAWFSALVGPLRYYRLGDERRMLNDYFLLVGPSGMGKGSSEHGPRRLFRRVEQILQSRHSTAWKLGNTEGVSAYPWLDIHDGGLSTGEGLAAAKADRLKLGKDEPVEEVTDKRFLLIESEFGNVLNQAQRQGNTLSHFLRTAFDGKTIRPLTKRDRVCVTDPYFVLVGNITPEELSGHDQAAVMTRNGMLNRMMMIWVQTQKDVPIPLEIPADRLESLALRMADAVQQARAGHWETHFRKQREMALQFNFDRAAEDLWMKSYSTLVRPGGDCGLVRSLCRRNRVHVLILSSLMALMNGCMTVQREHLESALEWSGYSRRTVLYSYDAFHDQAQAQRRQHLGIGLLLAIRDTSDKAGKDCTNHTAVYRWFGNRIRRNDLSDALGWCLSHSPPLIRQEFEKNGRAGRPTCYLSLTDQGRQLVKERGVL